jgi:hypothetical protein
MSNIIVKQASEYKLIDFFNSIQNYVPATLYQEQWYLDFKRIINLIQKNNLNEKFDFTDKRLVLIAYKAMEKFDTSGSELQWFVAKTYAEQYLNSKEQKSKDLVDFINMYIGYNFSSAEKDEKAENLQNKLKLILSKYLNAGELSVPVFIKDEIIGKVVLATKPDIEFAPQYEDEETYDVDEENREILVQLEFAESMLKDAISEEEETEWSKIIEMLKLLIK